MIFEIKKSGSEYLDHRIEGVADDGWVFLGNFEVDLRVWI